jgi:hypothetical protein
MAAESEPARGPTRFRGFARTAWGSAYLCGGLLLFVAIDGRSRAVPDDTDAHHARLRRLAEDYLPLVAGEWIGSNVPTPTAAVELLKPNVLSNRQFRSTVTGEVVSILVVQCGDARDLVGHYPPVCYPSHGMTALGSAPREWVVNGITIPGTRYRFADTSVSAPSVTVVDNFVLLPNGRIARDMDEMRVVVKDRRLRPYGAAQVQVVTDGAMRDERRDDVFRALVEPSIPLLMAMSTEANRDR